MDEFEKDFEFEEISEDTPVQEKNSTTDNSANPPRRRGLKKKRAAGILICALILAAIVVTLILCNFIGCNRVTVDVLYEFESDSNYQIEEYDGKAVVLGYDGATVIKLNGKVSNTIVYNMANPHMDLSGDMLLMYDKDNTKLAVFKGDDKKYSYECDHKIKSAKVSGDGSAVLVSDEKGYNYKVTVLNNKGKEEFVWQIGNEYLLDVDISPDGKKLVAVTIKTVTGRLEQNVVMVDVDKATETGRATLDDVMPLCVNFAANNKAVVISDDRICGYNTNAEKEWESSFENMLLDSFAVDEDGNTVLSLRGIKNNSIICAYTKNGKKAGEYITETKANYVDIGSKYIAVCESNKVSLVNYSGKVISSMEVQKEVRGISIIGNDKVILLCRDCILLFKM